MLDLIVTASFIAAAGYFVYVMWTSYKEQPEGSLWDKLLAAGSDSATKLWARFLALIGAMLGLVTSAADYLGDPQLSSVVQQYFKPDYVAYAMIGIAIVTIIARNRTK